MCAQLLAAVAAAKLLQSCLTLCDPIDSSPPGCSVSGILQARILEWVAISFSNVCMHAKSLQSCLTVRPHGQLPTKLLCPQDSPGKNTGAGCHFLLQGILPTQGSNLLFCESCIGWQVLYHQCHLGNFPPPCYPMRSTQTSFSGHSQWHFLGSGLRNVNPKTVLL